MTTRLPILSLFVLVTACGSGSSDSNSSGGPATGGGSGGSPAAGGSTPSGGSSMGGDAGGTGGAPAGGAENAGSGGVASGGTTAVTGCDDPDVRKCVCEDWQQSACCDGEWGVFCAITAEEKCGAVPPCSQAPDVTPSQNACCQTSTEPGCSDSAIELCVCNQLPDCCTNAWDSVCVELVRQQLCAPDVRTCVCEDWQQSGCCDQAWTDFCTITAEEKCGAQSTCL